MVKKAYYRESFVMINEEKVKIMNKLTMYERQKGKRDLPVSKYYRSDYIGLALIRNFFLVTIGYVFVLAAVAVYYSEYLMNNINQMDLVSLGITVVTYYGIVLVAYSVLTYIVYTVKYHNAKKSVKAYYEELTRLDKIYEREEKKNPGRENAGGHKK